MSGTARRRRSGNPNPSPATRIAAGRPPERRPAGGEGDEPVSWEVALQRLKAEAVEAISRPTRSLVRRLEIARALQILEAAESRGRPEPEDDWEERLRASMRPSGGEAADPGEQEESSDDEAPEA